MSNLTTTLSNETRLAATKTGPLEFAFALFKLLQTITMLTNLL